MAVEIGSEAPGFELLDQNKEKVRLADFRGQKKVVLIFHPLAFTGICEAELCSLRDNQQQFADADTEVIVISVDSNAAHKAWADQLGADFIYLADFWPHGAVAQAYGVFDQALGISKRGTFFIDKDGIVTDIEVKEVPDGRDIESYLERVPA